MNMGRKSLKLKGLVFIFLSALFFIVGCESTEVENEVIQTLIKFFFKDFSQKMYTLINKSKRNILRINYC